MSNDRTLNTTRNVKWGIGEKLVQMLLPFVTRTLMLKLIGEEYLGLNGLFTSIISVLNMADLGFGIAITYTMYKPIAENDNETLCAILNFYKKVYRIIGGVVLAVGVAFIPFLPFLIKSDIPSDVNIYILFSVYLVNTVLSYWLFAYKKSLLHAYHRDDINTKISLLLTVLQYGAQIFALAMFKSYYIYVIVLPLITFSSNLLTAVVTKKMYPLLFCRGKIASDMAKGIKKQVSGAFIGKVCGTTRNSLDSMFVSSFLGLKYVAIYGNYYYIMSAVHGMMNVATNSMVGGVGNSIVKDTPEKNYRDFTKFTFLYSWIAGWCSCCLLCLYQPFMYIWTGKELMLPFGTMLLFCIYLYVLSASDIKNVYYTAKGLWWEGRFRSVLEVVLNFLLNFIGAKYFGIFGIMLATIITMVSVNFLYGAKILFKNYFTNEKLSGFIIRHCFYLIVVASVSTVTYFVCSLLPNVGVGFLFAKAGICIVLPNILFLIAYCKTSMFSEVKPLISRVFSGFTRKIRRVIHK